MPDIAIIAPAVTEAPEQYPVPAAQNLVLKSTRASFDGTNAAGAYVPTLRILTSNGQPVAECPLGQTLASGASADVTWFPGGKVNAGASPPGGAGLQFNSGTYGQDNVGDALMVEATDFVGIPFSEPAASNDAESASIAFNAANGVLFTQAVPYSGVGAVVEIDQSVTSGGPGASALLIAARDTTANGHGAVLALNITAVAKSSIDCAAAVLNGTQEATGGSGDAYGVQAAGANTGTGREIGGMFQAAGFQTGAKSIALLCLDHLGNPIFEVRDDGTIHTKTAVTSFTNDL